jgi:hypothetical protein
MYYMERIPDAEFGAYGIADYAAPTSPPSAEATANAVAAFERVGVDVVARPNGSVTVNAAQVEMALRALQGGSGHPWQGGSGHPWHVWEAGRRWTIRRPLHFASTPQVFRTMLYQRAAKRGLRVSVEIIDDSTIAFQFRKKGAPALP